MPLRSRSILGACLLAVASLQAHHLGDPGSSPANASVLSGHLLEAGQVSLGWSWQLTQYPLWSKAELEAAVRAHGHAIYLPEQASRQALEAAVGAFDWLQLGLSLESQRLERLREGHVHADGSFGSHELGDPAGLGNSELSVKARLWKSDGLVVAFYGAGTLPTGQDDALTDGLSVDGTANTSTGAVKASPKYAYLGPAFQPGSGATVITLGLAASQEWGLWEGSASLLAKIPAAYRLFKQGNSASLGLAMGRLFGAEGHERGWLGLELAGNQSEPSNLNGVGSEDGGFTLSGGPRLRVPMGKRFLGVLGASWTLVQPEASGPAPVLGLNVSLQSLF